jgi:hypothetical protein
MELMLMMEPPPKDFMPGTMSKIDGHALVPVFGGYVFEAVAVVVGGVVDKDCGSGEFGRDLGDCGLQAGDVCDVAGDEDGWISAVGGEVFYECVCGSFC